MAALGAVALPGSLLFPWYGFKLGSPLSSTGFESFGFGHAALVLIALAALWVVAAPHLDRPIPRPLERGTLLVVAGAWALALIAYLMADRPDLLAGIATIGGVRLRYGIFVAAAGAGAIIAGGLRLRRAQAHPG